MWMWAHAFETEQLGMIPLQGVPCHSRGPHSNGPCTIGWPSALHGTLGCGPSHSRRTTLGWDHSKVFCVIPGAHIPMSHVLSASNQPYTGPWDVGPQPQDGTPWYGIIPGCSMLFLEPTFRCPAYDQLAITTGHWDVGPQHWDGTPSNYPIPECSVHFRGPTFQCPMYPQLAVGVGVGCHSWLTVTVSVVGIGSQYSCWKSVLAGRVGVKCTITGWNTHGSNGVWKTIELNVFLMVDCTLGTWLHCMVSLLSQDHHNIVTSGKKLLFIWPRNQCILNHVYHHPLCCWNM